LASAAKLNRLPSNQAARRGVSVGVAGLVSAATFETLGGSAGGDVDGEAVSAGAVTGGLDGGSLAAVCGGAGALSAGGVAVPVGALVAGGGVTAVADGVSDAGGVA
jgi:hypothetical protein